MSNHSRERRNATNATVKAIGSVRGLVAPDSSLPLDLGGCIPEIWGSDAAGWSSHVERVLVSSLLPPADLVHRPIGIGNLSGACESVADRGSENPKT